MSVIKQRGIQGFIPLEEIEREYEKQKEKYMAYAGVLDKCIVVLRLEGKPIRIIEIVEGARDAMISVGNGEALTEAMTKLMNFLASGYGISLIDTISSEIHTFVCGSIIYQEWRINRVQSIRENSLTHI